MSAGPIEISTRSNGGVLPTSKNHKNGYSSSMVEPTAPSKSERLNSPNTGKWEPDVRMLLSTAQWLKVINVNIVCWRKRFHRLLSTSVQVSCTFAI